jgi:hypothetical protein
MANSDQSGFAVGEGAEGGGVEEEEGVAVGGDEGVVGEFAEGAGEGFGGEVEVGGEVAFEAGEFGAVVLGNGEEVAGEATGGVAEGDVFDEADHVFDPAGHAHEEAEGEVVVVAQGLAEGLGGEDGDGGFFEGLGEGGAGEAADGGDFGEGAAGADEVEDVFFAGGGHFVDAYEAGSEDEDAGAGISLAEDLGGFVEGAEGGDGEEAVEGGGGNGAEHVAGGENVGGGEGHGGLSRDDVKTRKLATNEYE